MSRRTRNRLRLKLRVPQDWLPSTVPNRDWRFSLVASCHWAHISHSLHHQTAFPSAPASRLVLSWTKVRCDPRCAAKVPEWVRSKMTFLVGEVRRAESLLRPTCFELWSHPGDERPGLVPTNFESMETAVSGGRWEGTVRWPTTYWANVKVLYLNLAHFVIWDFGGNGHPLNPHRLGPAHLPIWFW